MKRGASSAAAPSRFRQLIARAAGADANNARVTLAEMRRPIELLFHAGGGAAGLQLQVADEPKLNWLQRMAGNAGDAPQPLLHADGLTLPATLALFGSRALNRDLYLWLASLAACHEPRDGWVADNLRATRNALRRLPGLQSRYERLCAAHLALRPNPSKLSGAAAQAERAVRAALLGATNPTADDDAAWQSLQASEATPVWLWLNPSPEYVRRVRGAAVEGAPGTDASPAESKPEAQRLQGGSPAADQPDRPDFTFFETKSLLSSATPIQVEQQLSADAGGDALVAAGDAQAPDAPQSDPSRPSSVKFDLDLGSAAQDDVPIGPGIRLPEWSWKAQALLPDHCTAQMLVVRSAAPYLPAPDLRSAASRVRRQLEALRSLPRRSHGETSGDELDIDAWVRHTISERASKHRAAEAPVFSRLHHTDRSLSCLLLADLSLSTVGWANDDAQIIHVIRDALYVFGEALTGLGDPFAMLGFSSMRRHHVRMQLLKSFTEPWNEAVRSRVGAIKPSYYTRMGAALRFATREMKFRPERQRLVLLLTDGKPNDLDVYEGRWGLEDTRQAVIEARAAGLLPYCVTIDREGHDYLPHLFGERGFAVVHRPIDLVARLTAVYAGLATSK